MQKLENGDIEFTMEESAGNCCPLCHKYDLNYGSAKIFDTEISCPWTCRTCGAEGNEFEQKIFDGHRVSSIPKGSSVPVSKRIAVIESRYVRDSQVYGTDPAIIGTDEDSDQLYVDMKNPCQFVGVFEGMDEDDIKTRAAESFGVHPGVISLIEI
jgi:hypothetical protein